MATAANEIYNSFESSFQDNSILPSGLEEQFLKKAVGRYSIEISELTFNAEESTVSGEDDSDITQFQIDLLAEMMKELYLEREVSKVNKRARIVTKDISVDGDDATKKYTANELETVRKKVAYGIEHLKTTAYS